LRTISQLLTVLLLLAAFSVARAEPFADAEQLLGEKIQNFRASGSITEPELPPNPLLELAAAERASRTYRSPSGQSFTVTIFRTSSHSQAYSLLTVQRPLNAEIRLGEVGTASTSSQRRLIFFKGRQLVVIEAHDQPAEGELVELGRGLAEKLVGEDDIPALVKHLPGETQFRFASYATSLRTLSTLVPDQPVLDVISFDGGTEAVVADYSDPDIHLGRLLIVEFTTPQLATDNDRQIVAKLNELNGIYQSVGSANVPTAYRRVGNYAVFVFGGSDARVANELINQVKYEQITQWLGENPYPLLEAQRRYTATTLGVLVSVVKASGIAVVVCLTAGGLFGALLFLKRRAQQRTVEAYSDAGGMLRLNLDEMTPQTDPARLLGK
jgi:hypothetical protein